MAKLIAFKVPAVDRNIWVSPDHVVRIAWGGEDRSTIDCADGTSIGVEGSIETVAFLINQAR